MAELSSNWKRLQAKLKAESPPQPAAKRKLNTESKHSQPSKRPKPNSRVKQENHRRSSGPMGGVQSSIPEQTSQIGRSPSMAVWAEDNDISAEAIAEAYSLGLKDVSTFLSSAKDKVNHGLTEGLEIGKFVAIDCEMVGVGPGGYESALARVSFVDFLGRQIYDSYVKPQEAVTDWRTSVSGISRKEMRFARDFDEAQLQAHDILKGRILVGHDVVHDLKALQLSHPLRDIRDTAKYHGFRGYANGRKPALRILAQEILQVEIQSGPHSSIEDARVTMLLFRKHKSGFDVDNANRFATKAPAAKDTKNRKGKKKRSR